MKELLKELGFEHLPMLSEFITETYTYRSAQARLTQIVEYKEFITKPLTKGMVKELFNCEPLKDSDFCFHEIDGIKTIEYFINNGVKLILR